MQRESQRQMHQRPRISREETKEPNDFIFNWVIEESERSVNYAGNLIQLSRDLLHNKWYDTFNFYFSKPINEILHGVNIPHVIAYKDNLFYDDETEYLKRYYKRNEVKSRMENITNFYFTLTEGVIRTTLPLHAQNSMILKRNDKLNKLLLAKLQNLAGEPQQAPNPEQLDPNANPMVPSPEDVRISNQNHQGAGSQDLPRLSQNVDIKEASSLTIDDPVNLSQNRVLPIGVEDNEDEKSFDSVGHDIFNPNVSNISVEAGVRDYLQRSMEKKSNYNRRRDIKAGDAFLEIGPAEKRLQKPTVQTENLLAVPQISDQDDYESNLSSPYSVEALERPSERPSESFKIQKQEIMRPSEEEGKKQSHALPEVSFSRKDTSPNNSLHNESKNAGLKHSSAADVASTSPFTTSAIGLNSVQKSVDIIVENNSKSSDNESSTRIRITDDKIEVIQKSQISPILVYQNADIQPLAENIEGNMPSQPSRRTTTNPDFTGHFDSQFRPADTLFTEDSIEREVHLTARVPKTSSEHVRDLMKKYYKVTDDELENPRVDRFKESSILARLVAMKKNNAPAQSQTNRNIRVNTTIRTSLAKDIPRQHTKGRANTEVSLVQSIQSFRGNHSPQNTINIPNGSSTARMPSSPNNKRSYNRFKSNEGIMLTQESSNSTNNIPTRKSPAELAKSIGDFLGGDMVQSLNRNYDAVEQLEQRKLVNKQHNKSKSSTNFIFQSTNFKGTHRAQDSISSTKVTSAYTTQPASAVYKPDLKLDFATVNHASSRLENAQGFWSCRSGKSDHLEQMLSARTPGHERTNSQAYKEHFLKQKYKQAEEAKVSNSIKPNGRTDAKKLVKPTSFNAHLGGEISDLMGKGMDRRGHPTARTGSISYPIKQFVNRKPGK